MPPKKDNPIQDTSKSQFQQQSVSYKFSFVIKQTGLENIIVFFQWFGANSQNIDRYDLGFVENWISENPEAEPDVSNIMRFEKDFSPIVVDEQFAKTISENNFKIFFVNADTSKVVENIALDFSSLLLHQKFTFTKQKLQNLQQIENFEMTITSDQPALKQEFKQYLNPLEITVQSAKRLMYPPQKQYLPVYVKYNLFGFSKDITTHPLDHNTNLKWDSKHVFLLKFLDQNKLNEQILARSLKFEIHDTDELKNDKLHEQKQVLNIQEMINKELEDLEAMEQRLLDKQNPQKIDDKKGKGKDNNKPEKKEAKQEVKKDDKKGKKGKEKKKEVKLTDLKEDLQIKVNDLVFGESEFSLRDLMNPNLFEFSLESIIYPNKKFVDDQWNNLDLNTAAKKDLQKQLTLMTYFEQAAILKIELRKTSKNQSTLSNSQSKASEVQLDQSQKIDESQQIQSLQHDTLTSKTLAQSYLNNKINDPNFGVFERAVYIMPYKCQNFVQKLQDEVLRINLKGMNFSGERQLRAYALTEQDKKDRNLDVITGFEILDKQFRIYILEGLVHKGMTELQENCDRQTPNTNEFKILKNCRYSFQERLYTDYNLDIKKIRLRENLNDILINPNIYMRTKVPESICQTLIQVNEIRKCDNLIEIIKSDLFPDAKNLIQIETKYSDSLSHEDITGVEIVSPKKTFQKNQSSQKSLKSQKQNSINMSFPDISFTRTSTQFEQDVLIQNNVIQSSKENHSKTFSSTIKNNKAESYNLQLTNKYAKVEEGREINIYAHQKNNYYEIEKEKLRQQVRNDKNNFYTYSTQYLSASINPYEVEDMLQIEQKRVQENLSKRKEFRSLPKKDQSIHPKQLHPTQREALLHDPYHIQQAKNQQILEVNRGKPLRIPGKDEFKLNCRQEAKYFMDVEQNEAENITAVEKEQQLRAARLKEVNEHKAKMIGDTYVYTNSVIRPKDSQLDKYKGLISDKPIKQGLLQKNSRIKQSGITLTRNLKDNPASIFYDEEYDPPLNKDIFTRKVNMDQVVSKYDFYLPTDHDILNKNSIHKVLKTSPFAN